MARGGLPRVLLVRDALRGTRLYIAPAAEDSPRTTYEALNSLRVNPAAVYEITAADRIELRRGDGHFTFDLGKLAFFAPFKGQVTGAVFSGRGHVVAAPRDPIEKQQMARFLGAPVLDEAFSDVYLRFTDETAAELLRELRAPAFNRFKTPSSPSAGIPSPRKSIRRNRFAFFSAWSPPTPSRFSTPQSRATRAARST